MGCHIIQIIIKKRALLFLRSVGRFLSSVWIQARMVSSSMNISAAMANSTGALADTVETAYKVYVCPRGNLLYMQIYLITDLKLL